METGYANSYRPSISRLPANYRGSILMVVLWSLCLLSAFAVILGYQVRQKAIFAKRLDERARLRFLAQAGVKKAISELKKEPEKTYDTFTDNWSNNPAVFKYIDTAGGTVTVSYNYIDEQSGEQETRYGLIDEESKININNISDENKSVVLRLLQRLFTVVLNYNEVEAQDLAASIIDWRDADSESAGPFAGAEDSYYTSLEYPYKAKNAKLDVLEELLLVKGVNENIFGKIRNYVTIYGSGRININTASKAVLLALGLSEDIAGKIIAFRNGDDGITGTSDDNIFDLSSNIVPSLSEFTHLSADEIAQLSNVANQYLGTKSENFFAGCLVKLNNRNDTSEVYCTLGRSGKILSWRES